MTKTELAEVEAERQRLFEGVQDVMDELEETLRLVTIKYQSIGGDERDNLG